ncbi:formyltetrahydrofolate deformylase [Aromatoleum evansii]|uniref:formyltetrahydrofolate deformylase n=1 Tax=Aromatoleum evansii TaxID=59406 RepID=UPI00145FA09A|nr:formyltetrahydrofolate deformylase [Aromatoleum evansii]NMG31169.1 formyltetrahydrofolate deformylase [Aromatoleum evansii]
MHNSQEKRWTLTVSVPSAAGQVAAISGFLDRQGCYINEYSCFDDELNDRFFVRCVFSHETEGAIDVATLRREFAPLAERFGMDWAMHALCERPKVLIMVSKLDHCLRDLLYRWRIGELPIDIVAVVSNHPDLEHLAVAEGLPFHHLPVTAETKAQQEAKLMAIVEETGAELVVLARYMQVLTDDLCRRLHGRAINIHHSFLPGFKGAKPYHQAHERGVKLIGATAHYVTGDLDEGPIIEQVVERVTHAHSAEQLLTVGRDMECQALARAVRFHIERRIFLNGTRTVVLP